MNKENMNDLDWDDLSLDEMNIDDDLDDIPDEALLDLELDDALRSIESGRFEIDDFILPEDEDLDIPGDLEMNAAGEKMMKQPKMKKQSRGSEEDIDNLDLDENIDDDDPFLPSLPKDDDMMLDMLSQDMDFDDILEKSASKSKSKKTSKSKKSSSASPQIPRDADIDMINDSLLEDIGDSLDVSSPLVIDGIQLDRQVIRILLVD